MTKRPRLIGKDRVEEARTVIADLHADGDVNHPLVNLQIEEMKASLREEGIMTWRKFFDLRVLFSTRARRYRLMLSKSSWGVAICGDLARSRPNMLHIAVPLLRGAR